MRIVYNLFFKLIMKSRKFTQDNNDIEEIILTNKSEFKKFPQTPKPIVIEESLFHYRKI